MDKDIRKIFLDYFSKRDHMVMPSSSLVPDNDPSVLLTTAGMQQFKPYYLGTALPPSRRIATLQKCFRTSDIDSVGYTNQHLTFFEMLGNFSFDDYFKKETIDWAMEFILDILNIPIERLRIGVFAGDKKIPADERAIELWKEHGIRQEYIYKYGKEDNFWGPAGSTGPCGPSTEIYYDYGEKYGCDRQDCSPSCDCDRYLEIWNLVFTQYNFDGKEYIELPNKNIDTGLGVERIYAVLENTLSVFRTSLFQNIIRKIEEISGITFDEKDSRINKSMRVIADHSRAIYFLASDGVTPSNEGRGYILRRIIRRAIRFARIIGIEDHFLNEIGEVVVNDYKGIYKNLGEKRDMSFDLIEKEEDKFFKTLKTGSKLLDDDIKAIKRNNKSVYDAKKAFRLYETFGFPVELTSEILKENDISIDIKKFKEYMHEHAEISKSKKGFDKRIESGIELLKKYDVTEFMGYVNDKTDANIISVISSGDNGMQESEKIGQGDKGILVLDKTVFFAEGGGQIGDKGKIFQKENEFVVENTREPITGIIIHEGFVKSGKFSKGSSITAVVDKEFRKNIRKNHTATHLLHWALRNKFGDDVTQAGSMVSDNRFRFDYGLDKRPRQEDIENIEKIINKSILNNDNVRCFETTREYAEEIGAISLFGEKYGKFVRVVEIDNYSRELCGGLHVRTTGEIGLFKILSDTNIGSNVRRIEAITGMSALNYLNKKEKTIDRLTKFLETDEENLIEKVDAVIQDLENYKKELDSSKKSTAVKKMIGKIEKKNIDILLFNFSKEMPETVLDPKTVGELGDDILNKNKGKKTFLILGLISKDKPIIILQSSKGLISKGLDCSEIAKQIGSILKGGGGGKREFAQVGGSDKEALDKAMDKAKDIVLGQLKKGEKKS